MGTSDEDGSELGKDPRSLCGTSEKMMQPIIYHNLFVVALGISTLGIINKACEEKKMQCLNLI